MEEVFEHIVEEWKNNATFVNIAAVNVTEGDFTNHFENYLIWGSLKLEFEADLASFPHLLCLRSKDRTPWDGIGSNQPFHNATALHEHGPNFPNILMRNLRLALEGIDVNFGFVLESDLEEVCGEVDVAVLIKVSASIAFGQTVKHLIDINQLIESAFILPNPTIQKYAHFATKLIAIY